MSNKKVYDLEERTFQFARKIRSFTSRLPKTLSNLEDSKQLIRSSGSIGANYIEANEALSKKDFVMRIKISRKEAKESGYFLRLIHETNEGEIKNEAMDLFNEAVELRKILSTILIRSS